MYDFIEKCLASSKITAALRFVLLTVAGIVIVIYCENMPVEKLAFWAAIVLPILGIDISKLAVLNKYNMPVKLEQSQIDEKKVELAKAVITTDVDAPNDDTETTHTF